MTVRSLQWPDDRDALLAHFEQTYSPTEVEVLAASYGESVGFDPAGCLVIDGDDGAIAAHGMLMPRPIQIGSSVLAAVEVGAVTVLPQMRERGYEALLVDALHDRMAARGDAFGLTFSRTPAFTVWDYAAAVGLYLSHYEPVIDTAQAVQAGHWHANRGYDHRTADRLGVRDQSATVRRFYINDLPAVHVLYTAASAQGHYLFARDDASWRWQIDHLTRTGRYEPDDFLVAEVDGHLVAYVRVVTSGDVNPFNSGPGAPFSVIEAAGTHPDAVEALLAEVARTARTFGADRIGLYVHPQCALVRHALVRGACLRHFTGAAFMRLNNLGAALDQLQPELDRRRAESAFAQRAYRLVVTTENDVGEITLGTGEPHTVALEIPDTDLVRLITGWFGADHLATGYHERHAALLRVLFPQRDPMIGMADIL